MRIAFFGTPEWAVPSFERLISDGHQVVAVFTQPDRPAGRGNRFQAPPVKIAALAHNLPVHQPEKIRTPEMRALLEGLNIDVAIIVAYGRIIPDWMLQIPKNGFINVHFSLLPAYRGAAPINWAMVNGEAESGITIMQVVLELDAGDILKQQAVKIEANETAPELGDRLSHLGADLLSETLTKLSEITPQPQDHQKATFAPIMKREDGLIVWSKMTAENAAYRVRGFQPWPGAFTYLKDTRLIIWKATVAQTELDQSTEANNLASTGNVQPGTIVRVDKNGIVVLCDQATRLVISELQLEGRKRLSARDFLNGVSLSIGEKLGE